MSVENIKSCEIFPLVLHTQKASKKPDPAINWCAFTDRQLISMLVEAEHNYEGKHAVSYV